MTKRSSTMLIVLVFTPFLSATSLRAQQSSTDDLRKQMEILTQTMKEMQKELQEIKALLQSRGPASPPQNVVLDLGDSPSQGDPTAKLTLVEFSDYQCPFCSRHVRETAPQIEKEYVSTGKVKHVFMDFPIESIHKSAFKAAEAANCAGEQGKYWEMHNRLFENQKTLEPWTPHATALGLDVPKFEQCLNSGRQAANIRRHLAEAQKAGVTGTPTFFLAYTDPKSSKITTVRRISGAQPYANFKAEIDKLLASEGEMATGKSEQK